MTDAEHEAAGQFDKAAWMENASNELRQRASMRKLTLKSRKSFKHFDESKDAPKEYVCPISLQLMRDPVLLVETGQIYDRPSIEGWFKSGKNTDPVTGLKLKSKRISPIFPLRSAIYDFARKNNIDLEPIEEGDESAEDKENGPDSLDVEPASIVGLQGVSAFDVRSLCSIANSGDHREKTAALKLLADMARFGNKHQAKQILQCQSVDRLRRTMVDSNQSLAAQSARLLISLPGDNLTLMELLKLLRLPSMQLRQEALLEIWQDSYRHRGKMLEIGKAIEDSGYEQIMSIVKPLADSMSNDDVAEDVRAYAAYLLCCMTLKPSLRSVVIREEITPLLVHFLTTTTDVGFRFCLLKACQYLCEDKIGREQVRRAGGIRIFVLHLPPRNRMIMYSTRVFVDWFAWVTVAETAVKAMFYLAKDEDCVTDMRTAGTIQALREMNRDSNFAESAKSKALDGGCLHNSKSISLYGNQSCLFLSEVHAGAAWVHFIQASSQSHS